MPSPLPWWAFLLAGLGHALLMALAFPPLNVWPVALVAIWPLVYAGCHAGSRPLRAGLLTAIGTLPFWLFVHVWLLNVTEPGFPGLAAYMCLYPALCVWFLGVARAVDWRLPMSVIVPVLWTGLEVIRVDIALTGYGFYLLGHPLVEVYALAAPASVLGAHVVGFLIAALAGCLADAAGWSGLPRRVGGIGAGVVVALWGVLSIIGVRPIRAGETFEYRVAVVQTNVPQDNKISWGIAQKLKDFAKFAELTRQVSATKPRPDVIVWPETMFPGYSLNASGVQAERDAGLVFMVDDKAATDGRVQSTIFHDELLKLQGEVGAPMLVGAIATDGLSFASGEGGRVKPSWQARYNSAFVVSAGQVQLERYDKIDLTPFGEVIPYVWRWPSLQQKVLDLGAKGMGFDLSSGTSLRPLEIPLAHRDGDQRPQSVRVATPICFEVTRSGLCRRLVNGSGGPPADLVVNLSNDGWFSFFDGGREAHLLAARWRCIELGLPMVRSVNTGMSAIIDQRGRVQAEIAGRATRVEGVITGTVAIERSPRRTLYRMIGETPWIGLSIAALGMTGAMFWRRRTCARLGR